MVELHDQHLAATPEDEDPEDEDQEELDLESDLDAESVLVAVLDQVV